MNLEKLKKDVVTWCDDNKSTQMKLSALMERHSRYVTLILNGHCGASPSFWNRLKKTTGLEEENYHE